MTSNPIVVAPPGPVTVLLLPVRGSARVTVLGIDAAPSSPRWPTRWVDTVDGHPVLWCGERRHVSDLPVNTSAWALAARLGCADLAERISLNGDLVIAGIRSDGQAGDVPKVVVQAAYRTGLLPVPVGTRAPRTGQAATAGRGGRA
jgi:hypothetical protein